MVYQTEAAVLFELNQPLRLVQLDIPKLNPGQVLVDIAYSGLCHSQLLEVRGKRGPDPFLPHTLGHEGSGIVLEVGPSVTKVIPGDHVVLSWIKGKGIDVPSAVYEGAGKLTNSGAISTFVRKAVISENRLTPIPHEIPLREAALLGCAIPTGAGIILNTTKMKAGKSLAIFGMGGIGMSALLGGRVVEAEVIIAIDIFSQKLERAVQLGATHTINAREVDPVASVMKITENKGVDYAIEAAGCRETMEAAFQAVCNNGGLCILAGNLPNGGEISINPFDLIKGKRIVGTWGGETQPDRDIPIYIELYKKGRLKLDSLITHSYGLKDINKALEDLEQGRVGRGMVEM